MIERIRLPSRRASNERLSDETSNHLCQLAIEHAVTADMDDGQPLPPFIEDGYVWHVVRRAGGRTLWRCLFLKLLPLSTGARRREIRHKRHKKGHGKWI